MYKPTALLPWISKISMTAIAKAPTLSPFVKTEKLVQCFHQHAGGPHIYVLSDKQDIVKKNHHQTKKGWEGGGQILCGSWAMCIN